jgi:hypothetical protein
MGCCAAMWVALLLAMATARAEPPGSGPGGPAAKGQPETSRPAAVGVQPERGGPAVQHQEAGAPAGNDPGADAKGPPAQNGPPALRPSHLRPAPEANRPPTQGMPQHRPAAVVGDPSAHGPPQRQAVELGAGSVQGSPEPRRPVFAATGPPPPAATRQVEPPRSATSGTVHPSPGPQPGADPPPQPPPPADPPPADPRPALPRPGARHPAIPSLAAPPPGLQADSGSASELTTAPYATIARPGRRPGAPPHVVTTPPPPPHLNAIAAPRHRQPGTAERSSAAPASSPAATVVLASDATAGSRHAGAPPAQVERVEPATSQPVQASGTTSAASAGAAGITLLGLACGLAVLALMMSSRLRLVPDAWHSVICLSLPERPG